MFRKESHQSPESVSRVGLFDGNGELVLWPKQEIGELLLHLLYESELELPELHQMPRIIELLAGLFIQSLESLQVETLVVTCQFLAQLLV